MSKTAKGSDADQSAVGQQVSFEDALKKLESIVEAMESADLPLETLLARFEEGARLAQMCQARLAEAELKIQQLEKTAAGQLVAKPLSLPEEPVRA
jgi:exodeoxyribonuclease VII small subunit